MEYLHLKLRVYHIANCNLYNKFDLGLCRGRTPGRPEDIEELTKIYCMCDLKIMMIVGAGPVSAHQSVKTGEPSSPLHLWRFLRHIVGRRGQRPLQPFAIISSIIFRADTGPAPTNPTSRIAPLTSHIIHTNYNLPVFLLFVYNIIVVINIITDKACDILIGPSIRLSVLIPSIIALVNEYIIKYKYVICPLNFLFLDIIVSIINIVSVVIDSYKNVGCTSIYFPVSYIPILHGRFVCVPYASTFTKFPHLPIACPKC